MKARANRKTIQIEQTYSCNRYPQRQANSCSGTCRNHRRGCIRPSQWRRMIDVLWEHHKVVMFAIDVDVPGTEITKQTVTASA
ncbi:MAG: hypothetical protein JWO19_934 [Bryobacterales bacterium]|nr:hypothetical protein [Bryobacterales bacterium]